MQYSDWNLVKTALGLNNLDTKCWRHDLEKYSVKLSTTQEEASRFLILPKDDSKYFSSFPISLIDHKNSQT